jgi:type IV fimbrial biogenesis protein FimU
MDFGSSVMQLEAQSSLRSRPFFDGGSRGFTLIELIVAVAIVGIFAAIAVPNFTSMIHKNRVLSAANELYDLLQYSRGEAVTRGVKIAVSAPGSVNTAWNSNVSVTAVTTNQVLRQIGAGGFQDGVVITTAVGIITFSPTGTTALTGCFKFTYSADAAIAPQYVGIQGSGRITAPSTVVPTTGECLP